MNKFAKYVPEADKKKQREHIGAMGLADMPFGEVRTQLIFEVSHGPIIENDSKPTYTLFTGDQKFKKTDTLIFEIRDDVFEVNSYFYDGYYNFQIWGTYDVYDQPVENPYPFAFYAGADDYCWDENGYHMSNYTLSFGYREEVYPDLDFNTEVKIYRKEIKTIDPKYLPDDVIIKFEVYNETQDDGSYRYRCRFYEEPDLNEVRNAILSGKNIKAFLGYATGLGYEKGMYTRLLPVKTNCENGTSLTLQFISADFHYTIGFDFWGVKLLGRYNIENDEWSNIVFDIFKIRIDGESLKP